VLQKVLMNLMSRQRIPDHIVISAVEPADIPEIDHNAANVRSVFGSAGLTSQRNRSMSSVINTADLIAFIDDDVIVGHDYFLNMESIFARDDSVVGVTGEVIADGASSLGFTFEEGLRLAQQYSRREKPASVLHETRGTYGCNMAFRTASIGSLRFDERLPLYGWQDDLDFCEALRHSGRIAWMNLIWEFTLAQHASRKRGSARIFADHQSGLYR
jgi:hypothetical protein